ncbi:MAG: acyltransferase [Rhodocyclales bacterium]|nr:acyltransferase [Rhodocyclales bacterium]MDB5888296.1 acyltransferase [Rhodocyclales bacterium]
MQTRDTYLDFLRGSAIVLVAIGHYLQGRSIEFDSVFAFRLIYAFHMPLFMFICGLTAAHGFRQQFLPATALAHSPFFALRTLPRKAQRLLLPFFAWAFVAYFATDWHSRSTLWDYLTAIVAKPDLALWFLPVLFCIYAAIGLVLLVYRVWLARAPDGTWLVILAISLSVGWLSLLLFRKWYLMTLASYYYPFFCAGLLTAIFPLCKFSFTTSRILALFAMSGFFCLLPFWQRTGIDPKIVGWLGQHYAAFARLSVSVAIATLGILGFMALARETKPFMHFRLAAVVRYLGLRTLPIYAMHIYFLGFLHNFLAVAVAIAASLGVDWLLQQTSWTRLLFLGERLKASFAPVAAPSNA